MNKKLEAAIERINNIREVKPIDFYDATMVSLNELSKIMDDLEVLLKPIQYVVNTWGYNAIEGIDDSGRTYASINSIFFRSAHPTKIKEVCHSGLNEMAKMMSLPHIQIEQITFVEL